MSKKIAPTHRLSSISKADSYEKIGEFWDTHDFTDYDDPKRPDVKFIISKPERIKSKSKASYPNTNLRKNRIK
ncbi:MAG: hypothetical protein NTX50_14625 [Candidatus Sumerlaeota bacterium]|nr:hypothetical protein [Candidatus Sumerlaeota bacterium]